MANCPMLHSFLFIAFVATISSFPLLEAKNNGFSVDLIHRDSPESHLYDPSFTPSQRLANALRRSFTRINHFRNRILQSSSASTYVIPDNGEYLMEIGIGTPPTPVPAIVDTGSDLIWTQCQPCFNCFEQKTPIFNPNISSTYRRAACQSKACYGLRGTSCDFESRTCSYVVSYADGSSSRGDISTDTITLGTTAINKVSLPNTVFGCGHNNGGAFGSSSGLVGLGGGQDSLVTQMGSSIHGKFSYCLVPFTQTTNHSKINFGNNAVVSGPGVVRTPLVPNSPETFYFLTLEGISVGRQRLDFNDNQNLSTSKVVKEGNIVIDSGTTLTLLPSDFYSRLESEVKHQIKKPNVTDPEGLSSLCYRSLDDAEVPTITVHFKGGDVKLNLYNVFLQNSEASTCLAFAPGEDLSIYGNVAQINFLVGYDRENKTVSFKATDCTKY